MALQILAMFLLISCTSGCTPSPMQVMLSECGVWHTHKHFQPIKDYYKKHLPNITEYVAYKEFTNMGTLVVALTKNQHQYTLTISVPGLQHGSVSKKISTTMAKQAFAAIHMASDIEPLSFEADFHPRCMIAAIKTVEQNHVLWVNNPSVVIEMQSNSNNKALRTYGVLYNLLHDQIPNYVEQLNQIWQSQPNAEVINGKVVIPIVDPEPSAEQVKAYRQQLQKHPFPEISMF